MMASNLFEAILLQLAIMTNLVFYVMICFDVLLFFRDIHFLITFNMTDNKAATISHMIACPLWLSYVELTIYLVWWYVLPTNIKLTELRNLKLQDSDGSQSNPGVDHVKHAIFCVLTWFYRTLIAGKTPSNVLEIMCSMDSREKIVERERSN